MSIVAKTSPHLLSSTTIVDPQTQVIPQGIVNPQTQVIPQGIVNPQTQVIPQGIVPTTGLAAETEREIVAQVLGIPNDKSWDIIDDNGKLIGQAANLVMINYNIDRADLAVYGHLRGVVVDINLRIKVADSYGFTPTAVADAIMPDIYGNLNITDVTGLQHVIPVNNSRIKYGLEGVLIRIFRWAGRTYHITHRRFDISNSRWGDSPPFLTIYENLGGPTADELFDPTEQYSPFVYFFLASHPSLLHVTKDQVGQGFLYYIGVYQMWSVESANLPFRLTDQQNQPVLAPGQTLTVWQSDNRPLVVWINPLAKQPPRTRNTVPSFTEESKLKESGQKPGIIILSDLSIPEANTLLRYGYQTYDDANIDRFIDPRLRTGEFIIIHKPDGRLLRVESTAYYWRARTTDDNPNRAHRFYQLSTAAYSLESLHSQAEMIRFQQELNTFRQFFPPMIPYNIESIKEKLKSGPIFIWDTRFDGDPHYNEIWTAEQRLYNIWAALFMASPVNRQEEIANLFDKYSTERDQLNQWLIQLRDVEKGEGLYDLSGECQNRIRVLIKKAERHAAFDLSNRAPRRDNPTFDDLFKNNLEILIRRESGTSVYSMIREMKRNLTAITSGSIM